MRTLFSPAADGRLVPYEELVERATTLQGAGFVIRAASLDDIMQAKESANRPKDWAGLAELLAIRDSSRE